MNNYQSNTEDPRKLQQSLKNCFYEQLHTGSKHFQGFRNENQKHPGNANSLISPINYTPINNNTQNFTVH